MYRTQHCEKFVENKFIAAIIPTNYRKPLDENWCDESALKARHFFLSIFIWKYFWGIRKQK